MNLKKLDTGNVNLAKIGVDEPMLDVLFDIAMLGMCRGALNQAKMILMDSLALQPERGRVLIALGLHCLASKDYQEAVDFFKNLLKQNPKNEYAKVHLGIGLWHLKKNDEAKKALEEVIAEKGDDSVVNLARAVLDEMKNAA